MIAALLFGSCALNLQSEKITKDIGLSFPPFKNNGQMEFTLGHLKTLNVNRIRISENWNY